MSFRHITNDTATELEANCKNIITELEAIGDGKMYRCTECGDFKIIEPDEDDGDTVENRCCDNDMEEVSMFDYFDDALDMEYVIDRSGERI